MITFPENQKIPTKSRVKFGIDPTAPRLHLGHLVPLRVVKQLKKEGHEIYIVIGTFTAMLGDPSGREQTRPMLTKEEVTKNSTKIKEQIRNILVDGYEIVHNTLPANTLTLHDFFMLASKFTLSYVTSRDAFQKRIENNHPISLHELLVPIMQGWDSVFLKAEIEIGGQDQLFNFQVARKMQEDRGQKPQLCILCPIINGIDGRKMSKSFDNCIFLDDTPDDIFGKCMSVSDKTMEEWIPLLTDLKELSENPMERKKAMAFDITSQICGDYKATISQKYFEETIQSKMVPEEMPLVEANDLMAAVVTIRSASRSEANRLIKSGAVTLNGQKQLENIIVNKGSVIKVGKRYFGKIS